MADLTLTVDGAPIPVYLGENTELAAAYASLFSLVPCTFTGTNALTMTPVSPADIVDVGQQQIFFGRAANTNTSSMSIVIPGFNDGDPRQIRLPGGIENVPAGAITGGEIIAVHFLNTGLFELLIPSATTNPLVSVVQDNADGNDWELSPNSGSPAVPSLFMFKVEYEQEEGGITVEIENFNPGDIRQLRMPNGTDQVAPGTFGVGDTVFFRMNLDTAHFDIVMIAHVETAAAAGSLTNYQTIELRRATNRLARTL